MKDATRNWFQRRVTDPLLGFLKQGVTPSKLAWAITAGVVIAYIPLFGSATLLCLLTIWLFGLNPAAVLLANQLAYPLQFIFFLPFLRAGEWLFNAPRVPFSVTQIFDMATDDLWGVISMLWVSNMYGLVVYVVVSVPLAYLLHVTLRAVFTRMGSKFKVQGS
jgi:uncharacterized protein (DUF2062 family)